MTLIYDESGFLTGAVAELKGTEKDSESAAAHSCWQAALTTSVRTDEPCRTDTEYSEIVKAVV